MGEIPTAHNEQPPPSGGHLSGSDATAHNTMNLFKTTIATAAVITCCMGNEMPASAASPAQLKACAAQNRKARAHWFFNETGVNYGSIEANSKAAQAYANRLNAMGVTPSTPLPYISCFS